MLRGGEEQEDGEGGHGVKERSNEGENQGDGGGVEDTEESQQYSHQVPPGSQHCEAQVQLRRAGKQHDDVAVTEGRLLHNFPEGDDKVDGRCSHSSRASKSKSASSVSSATLSCCPIGSEEDRCDGKLFTDSQVLEKNYSLKSKVYSRYKMTWSKSQFWEYEGQ